MENENEDDILIEEKEEYVPHSRAAIRRKNNWKYAQKRYNIASDYGFRNRINKKPLHYYSKNSPWDGYASAPNKTNNKGSRRYISKNYASQKNWNEHDKRQIQNFENQIEELFDFEQNS